MSHYRALSGRPFVECDDPVANSVTGELRRCGRRSFGARERFGDPSHELSIFDLPRNWSVAPYPDNFDHGAVRTSLLDGTPIQPIPNLVGIVGDLHTCPTCNRRLVSA